VGSGAFWIDPAGMRRLYGPPRAWAEAIRAHLGDLGWRAAIVVGFGRFLTRALAEGSAGVRVLATRAEEIDAATAVPLARLDLPRRRLGDLAALEVHTLGDLLRLPAAELRARFGREVAEFHAQASGARWDPLRPQARREAITATLVVDPPESVDERLLFAIKGILPGLLDRLAAAGERAAALDLRLELEREEAIDLRIAAAEPTDDLLQLLDLVRLRLGALPLPAPVAEIILTLEGVRPERPQIGLLVDKPRRDVTAAARALERVRAAYGDAAVTRASLRQAHLPEASFAWEPVQAVALPQLPAVAANMSGSTNAMIRRLLRKPVALGDAAPEVARADDDAEGGREPPAPPSLAGVMPPTCGAIRRLHGPYRVSGGWWVRAVERDYYYAETTGGELLWLYFDQPRRRWFLHGVVD
jgi:protein ImuB